MTNFFNFILRINHTKSKILTEKEIFKVKTFIKLFSTKKGEINRFLKKFYCNKNTILNSEKTSDTFFSASISALEWKKSFDNPIEMADMIGVFIDNMDDFKINMWICLDKDILINVTNQNVDDLIRYLYERFPY